MTPTTRDLVRMRLARKEDVPAIVRLFALPEEHNAKHEEPGPPLPRAYEDAFDAIASDANNALWIAEHEGAGSMPASDSSLPTRDSSSCSNGLAQAPPADPSSGQRERDRHDRRRRVTLGARRGQA